MAGLLFALDGCSTAQDVNSALFGPPPDAAGVRRLSGFIGAVVADEPNAALAGREVLATGGNAIDAAVAVGFTLAVTYPSRAGLGGGGACVVYMPNKDSVTQGRPESVVFLPGAPATSGGARPAAVPLMARGLFAMSARYGTRQIESLLVPAEQLARFGVPVSRAFARDLAAVGAPLLADPTAATVFGTAGTPLGEGAQLVQPDLAVTMASLRVSGVGDMYQGALARRLVAGAQAAGARFTAEDLRTALPAILTPLTVPSGNDLVAFLPPPADGGLAAAAAFAVLQHAPGAFAAANDRSRAVLAQWRAAGGDPMALLQAAAPPASLPALPASTSFTTIDKDGNAVGCAVTMNNLFGTGRIVENTGLLLAASPAAVPSPMLTAAIAYNGNLKKFRAVVAGSGQEGAALAVAGGLVNALRKPGTQPVSVPEPGRVNEISCSGYMPEGADSCVWSTDPRGNGLALAGDQ